MNNNPTDTVAQSMEAQLLAWAAWLTSAGNANGYPSTSPLHPNWSPPSPGTTPTMKVAHGNTQAQRALHAHIQCLTERQQHTLCAVYVKRLNPQEQAAALQCQPATVRQRVTDIKRKLWAALQAANA